MVRSTRSLLKYRDPFQLNMSSKHLLRSRTTVAIKLAKAKQNLTKNEWQVFKHNLNIAHVKGSRQTACTSLICLQ